MSQDIADQLQHQVQLSVQNKTPLRIVGGDTKSFYGNISLGEQLKTTNHTGIVEYDPTELVVTVRSGTTLQQLKEVLAEHNQMLPFEPPTFGSTATIGGTIACGFSGPRRPFAGSARDFVLGCKVLTGKGEIVHFGGRVIKNVAGYDVSRLMVGALGTLGVILEISMKVLPMPEAEITLAYGAKTNEAIDIMNARAAKPLPLSAVSYDGEAVLMRICGNEALLKETCNKIAGDKLEHSQQYWDELNEHKHFFFAAPGPLWRLSVAPATLHFALPGNWFFDWVGGVRWLKSWEDPANIRDAVEAEGGHATLFGGKENYTEKLSNINVFHPLKENVLRIHQRLKKVFDPHFILNKGRFFSELESSRP